MSSLLSQFPSDDSVLLMYLAGELSSGEASEMDRRLASDDSLRLALSQLEAVQQAVKAGLGRLDAADPMPVDESAAVRNVARAMRQWTARPAAIKPAAAVKVRVRLPYWVIGSAAAAAAVVLGMSILPNSGSNPQLARTVPNISSDILELRDYAGTTLGTTPELARSLPRLDSVSDDAVADTRAVVSLEGALADAQVFEVPTDPADFPR